MTADITRRASRYGRYGYRRITAMLRSEGWTVNAKRVELLNAEVFYSLAEAKVIIEAWRRYYNTERPHSSLGYKPPAPEAIL